MADDTKMRRRTVDTLSVGAGAAVGLITVLGGLPVAADLAAGIGTWAFVRWLVFGPLAASTDAGMARRGWKGAGSVIDDGLRQVNQLEELGRHVKRAEPRADVAAITRTMRSIFDHFRENPEDVRLARKFLAIYMERTVAVVERYVQYQDYTSPEAQKTRLRVERELLPRLRRLCADQYQKFLDADIRDYDVDVEVLKKTIDLEGLG